MAVQNSGCLLVDIGNQRVKWSLISARSVAGVSNMAELLKCLEINTGVFNLATCQSADQGDRAALLSSRPDRIIASTVAGNSVKRRFEAMCARYFRCAPEYVESPIKTAGLTNGYDEPGQLGVDRWLAGVAAWHLMARESGEGQPNAVIVVDAGTAVTVDLINRRRFEGGVIMPGIARMIEVLGSTIGKIDIDVDHILNMINVDKEDQTLTQSLAPTNTADAVRQGVFKAVCAGVNTTVESYVSKLGPLPLLLTGGDSDLLAPVIKGAVTAVPHLVLAGLAIQSLGALQ